MAINTDSPLLLYLSLFLFPFLQEDAAVITAASLSITGTGKSTLLFLTICLGLFFSDIWKYWVGHFALKNDRARAYAEKKHVADLKDKVLANPFAALVAARFVPLTRIPCYVACGFFGVPYWKFCIYVAITAVMYVSAVFALFHILGAVAGEKLLFVLPLAVISMGLLYFGIKYILNKRETG